MNDEAPPSTWAAPPPPRMDRHDDHDHDLHSGPGRAQGAAPGLRAQPCGAGLASGPALGPGNRLVALMCALLPSAELDGLERVALPAGRLLLRQGQPVPHAWFPDDALVSVLSVLRNGASLEVALVGAEGLAGGEACLAGLPAAHDVMVQLPGHAWRLPARVFAPLCRRVPLLHEAAMHAGLALLAQAAQTAACNRHHCMEQQVSRWLLAAAQRLRSEELPMTQQRLAALLGVRREGVTECARRLQSAGLIRYARGRIRVLDPAGLARRACECHAVASGARQRLNDALERLAAAR